ncbi:MAG: hypothetical protein AAGH89_08870 [Verrucomicrobiota bacterium]
MKSLGLLICGFLLIGWQQSNAQSNLGLQEYERRQQEAALQRARQLKAAKEAAVQIGRQESAGRSTQTANPAARNQAAPPLPQFRLVTSTGVVNWTPGTPMPIQPQAKEQEKPRRAKKEKPVKEESESQLRTVRFSFGRQGTREADGEQANVKPLEQANTEPVVDVGPAEEEVDNESNGDSESRFPWRSRRQDDSEEAETEMEEVVAIIEEIPESDGKPARTRILGVLMRGEQAESVEEEIEAVASVDKKLEQKRTPLLVSFNRRRAEAPQEEENSEDGPDDSNVEVEALEMAEIESEGDAPEETIGDPEVMEEQLADVESTEEPLTEERAYALRGLRNLFEGGQKKPEEMPEPEIAQSEDTEVEGAEAEEEPIEVASIEPADTRKWRKWLSFEDRAVSEPESEEEILEENTADERPEPTGPIDPNFFAIDASSAPFHVIDSGPEDTFIVELDQGAVGRTHGSGENWTWLEMHDGLMGLMRKKHLRPARQSEVMNFLAMESGSGLGGREPIQFVEIDLPDLPEDVSDAGMFLGEGLLPALSESTPSEATEEPMEVTVEETVEPVVEKAADPLE